MRRKEELALSRLPDYEESAAIGGNHCSSGAITIHGGMIKATANGHFTAAIGGGEGGNGKVTIHGGTVIATASGEGAAIGSGQYNEGGGWVTITGGRVSAVNTNDSSRSLGGDLCEVSLGWTKTDDYVYAAGYTAVENMVMLTTDFRVAGIEPALQSDKHSTAMLAGMLLISFDYNAVALYKWRSAAFTLPSRTTSIGERAFAGIQARTVLVPAGVTKVGKDAFADSRIEKIRFMNGNTTFEGETEEGTLTAFEGCPFVIAYAPKGSEVLQKLGALPNVYVIEVE